MKKIWKKMLFAGVVFFALAMVNSSGRNLVASNGFLIANGELVEYSGGASHVRVPSGVKSIGAAFKNCKKLRQYPFHKGLGSIGKEAFSGCILLQKANLPNSVKKMEDRLLRDVTVLRRSGNNRWKLCIFWM